MMHLQHGNIARIGMGFCYGSRQWSGGRGATLMKQEVGQLVPQLPECIPREHKVQVMLGA